MLEAERPTSRVGWLAVLALLAAAYGIMLFGRGFVDPDEGRYAEIPREMVVSGNWLEMRMMGFRYYEKPILSYWLTAPALALFGPHDWAARLPLWARWRWPRGWHAAGRPPSAGPHS
ncbi:MAG: hypothetical protein NTV49_01925 [Kiritimatiellaeota bacterium]|nr:hypothetical protein [Kiritimatiellota bacterium]